MDPRRKVCSQVKLGGGKMRGGGKIFRKFSFLPNDYLGKKKKKKIPGAELRKLNYTERTFG